MCRSQVCTFRFLHEWFDDDGQGKPKVHKPIPVTVCEFIFRAQKASLKRMAGLKA